MAEPHTVTVQYFGAIQALVPRPVESLPLPGDATVQAVLEILAARHGERLVEALLGPDGAPLPNTLIMLDGANVLHRQGLESPVEGGASLRLVVLPAFTGGG